MRVIYVISKKKIKPKLTRRSVRSQRGPHIIRDIAPYRSAATDIATGKRALIGGRRQHREFLRRNGYLEVGNDYVPPRREPLSGVERIADIRRALEQQVSRRALGSMGFGALRLNPSYRDHRIAIHRMG